MKRAAKLLPFVLLALLLSCDRVVGLHDLEADLACVPGEERSCYSGPPDTLGTAPCREGTMRCSNEGDGFGACVGEVTPSDAFTCDATAEPCADLFAKLEAGDTISIESDDGTPGSFTAATNYTASMWLWLDPATSAEPALLLRARRPTGASTLEVEVTGPAAEGAPGSLAVTVGGDKASTLCQLSAAQSLPLAAWVHLGVSVSARNNDESFDLRIFENGQVVAATKCFGLEDSTDNLVWAIGGSAFLGRVDDFALERPAKAFGFTVGPSPFDPSKCGPAFFAVDFEPEQRTSDTRWTSCGAHADLGSGDDEDAPSVEPGLGCQPG